MVEESDVEDKAMATDLRNSLIGTGSSAAEVVATVVDGKLCEETKVGTDESTLKARVSPAADISAHSHRGGRRNVALVSTGGVPVSYFTTAAKDGKTDVSRKHRGKTGKATKNHVKDSEEDSKNVTLDWAPTIYLERDVKIAEEARDHTVLSGTPKETTEIRVGGATLLYRGFGISGAPPTVKQRSPTRQASRSRLENTNTPQTTSICHR